MRIWLLVLCSVFLVSCKGDAHVRFINNTDIPQTMYLNGDSFIVYARSVDRYRTISVNNPNLSFHEHNIAPQLVAGKHYSILGKYNSKIGAFEAIIIEDMVDESSRDNSISVYNLSDQEISVTLNSNSEINSFVVDALSMRTGESSSDDVKIYGEMGNQIAADTLESSADHEVARIVIYNSRKAFFVFKNYGS